MPSHRSRLRDLGISIGVLPTGPLNAITDVEGVQVGHFTLIHDTPRIARTGVTVILPRPSAKGHVWDNHCFAGFHVLNGNGDFTGTHWLEESGHLTTPIGLTNTNQVGLVRDTLAAWEIEHTGSELWTLPLAAETCDSWLNDMNAFSLREEHVRAALQSASGGPVAEGNVGGGTGMICYDFKGGIGTSSRVVETASGRFTVGVLVQANFGDRANLRVDGVPVGREINHQRVPDAWTEPNVTGRSIIIILATDAPLLASQCRRLAQRATIGLARTGGVGHNGSGDLFLAFSTGNDVPAGATEAFSVKTLPQQQMNPLFDAAVESTEEAILNALTAAETMTGYKGRTAHALPLDTLVEVMRRFTPG
jgi:D-aminopeptidase